MKKILFQDTTFRDGFQSFFGARVLTKDFLDAVRAAQEAGITHLEAGGGARFQTLFMYCGESAFDMMDSFRKAVGTDANLQTLSRGISVVALSAQPKDMIDLHAKMFKKHGMTHIRNFDALNDMRNLKYSGEAIQKAGLHHQACITIMELPPGISGSHDPDFYMKILKNMLDTGVPFDSICFKDSSGITNPKTVYETVKGARKMLGEDAILWIHTHDTAGIGISQYKAAIEGGINGVCLARSPLSSGTSQPDLLSLNHVLKGTEYTLDIDIKKILKANGVLKKCMEDYFFPPEAMELTPEVMYSPMPGGAYTANTMMMRDTGTLHLFPEVIKEMGECIVKGGFGTSVTPVSQFYFQQAYSNVTQGRWKKIIDGYGKMVLGYFGRTPIPPDPEIIKIAEQQLDMKVFTGDPLEIIEPGIPNAKEILEKEGLPVTDENLFIIGSHATPGGNKGLDFLKGNFTVNVRKNEPKKSDSKTSSTISKKTTAPSNAGVSNYKVVVEGKPYTVSVEEIGGTVTSIEPGSSKPDKKEKDNLVIVKASLPGNVYQVPVETDQKVKKGDTLIVIEAMKMETKITSPCEGIITEVSVKKGDVVQVEDILLSIRKN